MPVVRLLVKIASLKHAYPYIDSIWNNYVRLSRSTKRKRETRRRRAQDMRQNTQYKYVGERKNFMNNRQQKEDNRAGMRFICFCMKPTFFTIVDTWSEGDLESSRLHSNLVPRRRSLSLCYSKMKNRWCGDVSWADKTHMHTQLDRPEKAQKMEESSENQRKLMEPQKSKKIELWHSIHIAHFLCEDSTSVFV